ncbi:hypothetical protein [Cohnella cellulosilytica]|uniref:Uncharacterized protein n=1 Tax=Cohnella cellulosilytica TaxID=986710 RepID=A0ABW2F5G8_9BACL
MEKIKRHAALPALAAAIAIIVALTAAAYRSKDNGTFEIRDLAGSREAIRDIAISGELGDGVHRTRFRIEEGRMRADTELFEQPKQADFYRYAPGSPARLGELEYSVQNTSSLHTIMSRKMTDRGYAIPVGSAEVVPPPMRRDSEDPNDGVRLANPPEYGLAGIGDNVYYTVPVSSQFVGTSAIYELEFYPWGFRSGMNPQDYASRRLVDFSLEANRSGEGTGIEILGLEAVGDRLVLISAENETLHIRSYDGRTGEALGEAAVPEFRLPAREYVSGPATTASYYEGYEAYPDHERLTLTLNFRRGSSTQNRTDMTALSFEFADGVELANRTELAFSDGEEDTYNGISRLGYRNGKLYAIRSFREPETERSRAMYDIVRPKHLYMYVYENSKPIYKGEIVTDLNDDNIRAYNQSPMQGGFGYSQMEYRYFTNIVFE